MSWGNLIQVELHPVLVPKRMLHDRIGSGRPDIISTHGPLDVLALRRTLRCRLPDSVPQHGASTLGQQNQAHCQDQDSRKGATAASSRSFLRQATAKGATLYHALGIIWQSGVSVKINASTTRIKPVCRMVLPHWNGVHACPQRRSRWKWYSPEHLAKHKAIVISSQLCRLRQPNL